MRGPLCPRCKTALRPHLLDGIPVQYCPSCGGLWIQQEGFKKAMDKPPSEEPNGEVQPEFAFWEEPGSPCPVCSRTMIKANYAYSSGIVVDRCEVCRALWLDRGELLRLRTFVNKQIPRKQIIMAELQAEAIKRRYQEREASEEAKSPMRRISLGSILGRLKHVFLKD